ncbi:MAG: hypothetical protein WD512_13500 [Candidatus Paceibacterota bacterium]
MKKLLILLLLPLLLSCDKEPIVVYEKADVIVIDLNDITQYTYYDMSKDYGKSEILGNGEGLYRFTVKLYEGNYYLTVITDRHINVLIPSLRGDIEQYNNGFKQTFSESDIVKYKIHYRE